MKVRLLSLFLFFQFAVQAQDQTVGVFINDSLALNGYTLIAPSVSTTTWLIDNCGAVVHEWESDFRPGLSAYLLENGDLLRACRIQSGFNGGGTGGRIERHNWDGELVWAYNHSSEDFHHHHDMELLPNGNILLIAWERHTTAEAVAMGRNPALIDGGGIWSEQIVELKPIGSDSAEIVWEWHLWDHLVQDFDGGLPNFGVVAQHPELMNINFGGPGLDWIHFNAIDYNAALDQIMVSSRHVNELWIIDHSTTTAEAASHEGGNSGMGGDLLYRYGNPIVYNRGTVEDQKFYGQHDAQWIEPGLVDEGKIMVFNNGIGRPGGTYSSIDVLDPPLGATGNYFLPSNDAFGPLFFSWSYLDNPPGAFYSSNISGAHRLPNGNTFVCEGRQGRIFEVTEAGERVWEYRSPVGSQGIVPQGSNINNNQVFRSYRYATDYPAFLDKDLTPGEPIELDPVDYGCQIYDGLVNAAEESVALQSIRILGNPIDEWILIENKTNEQLQYDLISLTGQVIFSEKSALGIFEKNVEELSAGIYFLRMAHEGQMRTEKVVIQ